MKVLVYISWWPRPQDSLKNKQQAKGIIHRERKLQGSFLLLYFLIFGKLCYQFFFKICKSKLL